MHEPSKGKNPNAKVPAAAPESHTATGTWTVVAGKNGTKSKGKGKSLVNRDSGMAKTKGKQNKEEYKISRKIVINKEPRVLAALEGRPHEVESQGALNIIREYKSMEHVAFGVL